MNFVALHTGRQGIKGPSRPPLPTFFAKFPRKQETCLGWLAKMANQAFLFPAFKQVECLAEHLYKLAGQSEQATIGTINGLFAPLTDPSATAPDAGRCTFHDEPEHRSFHCALSDARRLGQVIIGTATQLRLMERASVTSNPATIHT